LDEKQNYRHLLLLGGGGRAGLSLLQQALERGYRVTAVIRNPTQVNLPENSKLTVISGDISDPSVVSKAMGSGVDAVLSTLGVFVKKPSTPLTDMTGPILQAMHAEGVNRIVCMSSLGVGDTRKLGNLTVRFVTAVILKHVLVDKQCQEKLLEQSGLDWTILRPPRIIDSNTSSDYLRWRMPLGGLRPRWQISKYDAAKEMLDLLAKPDTIRQTWQISN
jgi:putative NADH-flavin reductase